MIKSTSQGFIAITTVMILAVVLLIVASSLSFSGFFTRYNILDSELKKISNYLAEACAETVFLRIANNPNYSSSVVEEVNIDGKKCQIVSVSPGYPKTIIVKSEENNYVTELHVIVDSEDLNITKWEEVASP